MASRTTLFVIHLWNCGYPYLFLCNIFLIFDFHVRCERNLFESIPLILGPSTIRPTKWWKYTRSNRDVVFRAQCTLKAFKTKEKEIARHYAISARQILRMYINGSNIIDSSLRNATWIRLDSVRVCVCVLSSSSFSSASLRLVCAHICSFVAVACYIIFSILVSSRANAWLGVSGRI